MFWNALCFDPKYILLNPHDSIIFENNLNKVAVEYLQMWVFVVLVCMFEKNTHANIGISQVYKPKLRKNNVKNSYLKMQRKIY